MRWIKPNLRSSIWALFGATPLPQASDSTLVTTFSLEDIRRKMLELAGHGDGSAKAEQVIRHIRYATDAEGLYFIRSELMALLASIHGEAVALDAIDAVSEMFEDLLPAGLRSRPSPLAPSIREAARSR
jgi:hypothetical protein